MRVFFISPEPIINIQDQSLPTDLMREFVVNGWETFIVCPTHEKQVNKSNLITFNYLFKGKSYFIKLLNQLILPYIVIFKIRKEFTVKKIDLVIIPTPPFTLKPLILFFKSKYKSFVYLWLKDIFPQNAVDLKIIKKNSVLRYFFRTLEVSTYKSVDSRGCMSKGNMDYVIKNNPYLDNSKLHISPNCIDLEFKRNLKLSSKVKLKKKYYIKDSDIVIVFGGNIGIPQSPSFLLQLSEYFSKIENIKFFIIGNGTNYSMLKKILSKTSTRNIFALSKLDIEQYYSILNISDYGLISLDFNFTVPNFPSRILSYMLFDLPIISFTDRHTDIRNLIIKQNLGYAFDSIMNDNTISLLKLITKAKKFNSSKEFLELNYSSKLVYKIITNTII